MGLGTHCRRGAIGWARSVKKVGHYGNSRRVSADVSAGREDDPTARGNRGDRRCGSRMGTVSSPKKECAEATRRVQRIATKAAIRAGR